MLLSKEGLSWIVNQISRFLWGVQSRQNVECPERGNAFQCHGFPFISHSTIAMSWQLQGSRPKGSAEIIRILDPPPPPGWNTQTKLYFHLAFQAIPSKNNMTSLINELSTLHAQYTVLRQIIMFLKILKTSRIWVIPSWLVLNSNFFLGSLWTASLPSSACKIRRRSGG